MQVSDVDTILHPWFITLQKQYVSSQLKFDMLIRAPAFARAGVELVDQLASCFVLHRAPSGATLYHAGDRPNGAFLLIEGTVDLFAPPRLNLSGPRSFEDTQPSLVMRRSQLSECAWVGEGALFHGREPPGSRDDGPGKGYRRSHTARAARACQMLRLPQASFARFEQLATVLLPMLRTHDKRLEELVADPPPKFGHATKRVEAAGEDAGLKEMQQFAHEAALAARVREFDIAEAHRRFEQSQHRDLKATFIYNLASAYDRIDRYKRLQEGEKAPRSASLQKGSSPRKATATPQSLVAGPSHAAPTPAPTV